MRFVFDEHVAFEVVRFVQYAYSAPGIEFIHVLELGEDYERNRDQWMVSACSSNDIIVTGDRSNATRFTNLEIARAGNRMLLLGAWFDHLPIQPRALWFVNNATKLILHGKKLQPGMVWRLDKRCAASTVVNEKPRAKP